MLRSLTVFIVVFFAGVVWCCAQVPSLIKDINQTSESSTSFRAGAPLNNHFVFGASDGVHGEELWITNGAADGTMLLADINEGPGASDPRAFTPLGSDVLFIANDGIHGLELWRTNGTTGGTALVADLVPGAFSMAIRSLTRDDNRIFFKAYHDNVFSLYVTDGTTAGTVKLKDFALNDAQTVPDKMVVMNHVLYFRADNGDETSSLWRSDGTAAGTLKVSDVSPASHLADSFLAFGNTLLFSAADGVLYQSDGTAGGTKPFQDLLLKITGATSVFQNSLYFTEHIIDSDGDPIDESIVKLWKYNGTAASVLFEAKVLTILGATDNALYLGVAYGEGETHALWKSNGTSGGTVPVKDLTSDAGVPVPVAGSEVGGRFVFVTRDLSAGDLLWTTNGTAAGTAVIGDLTQHGFGWIDAVSLIPGSDNNIFFWADNAITGIELWTTDGTLAGTGLVKDVAARNNGSSPYGFKPLGGQVLFAAYTDVHGIELWKTDGSTAGTVLVKDIKESGSANPTALTFFNNRLYFAADGDITGQELWSTDGTAAGTTLTADVIPGSNGSFPANLFVLQNSLYFWAGRQDGVYGLWKSDGTNDGTTFVAEDAGPFSGGVVVLEDFALYFNTMGVWRTNGTAAGTLQLQAFTDFEPTSFAVLNNEVYFAGKDAGGFELWKTDGTAPNTVRVKDIRAGAASATPQFLTTVHNRVLFAADDGIHGAELWKSDGTAGGTTLVKDIYPGATGSGILWIRTLGAQAFLNADDGTHGNELWTTDATAAGTTLFHDFSGDASSSFEFPGSVGMSGGKLFMNLVEDGASVGITDGTAAGTSRIVLDALQQSPLADQMLAYNKLVLFSGATEDMGEELWALDDRDEQAITFQNPGNKAYGDPDFALVATANSGMPVRFESSPIGILEIPASTAHILKPGGVTITAIQDGNSFWKPATAAHAITISKGTQVITFNAIADKLQGGPDFQLMGTSSVGLPVSFASGNDKLSITGTLAEIVKPGRATVTATQPGNQYYQAAPPVEQAFCIRPAKPVITLDNTGWPVVLTSSHTVGNQWYLNGVAVQGATAPTHTPESTGAYTLVVTIDDCASDVSATADVVVLGLEEGASGMKVHPNPAEEVLTVEAVSLREAAGYVYNANGQRLQPFQVRQGAASVPVQHLAPGLYFLRVQQADGKSLWCKFVKR